MGYTQSPHLTDREIESVLETAKVARFCSLNADGTIHAAPVWFLYIDGHIVVATPKASCKARNVVRNNRVTLLIDDSGTPGVWPKGVLIYGRAAVSETSLELDEAARLLEKYFPPDRAKSYATGLMGLTTWARIIVKPERIASFDYMKDEPYQTATGE